jgi:hypothetical protein
MKHTDEHGRASLARSTVAKRMRGALKGHKNVARRTEAKVAIFKEGAPIYAHRSGAKHIKNVHGPFRSREHALGHVGKKEPRGKEVTTMRGKHGTDIRWARNPHYK